MASGKKIQIAPSLLACDLANLREEVRSMEAAGADVLHFDVMDGTFVPNISLGLPVIEKVRVHSSLPFDAHLMIANADAYIEAFHQVGCNWLSVHIEACPHINRTIYRIKELGMKAGVAINPGTSIYSLEGILDDVDYVLVMSVNPGFGGQKFLPPALHRITEIRKNLKNKNVPVQVDGGIKLNNISDVVRAGAEIIVVGTGIFEADNYKERINALRQAI